MNLKMGVDLRGIRPEALVILMVAQEVYQDLGAALWITSAKDGKHKEGSLHYQGCAFDLRLPSFYGAPLSVNLRAAAKLREGLGAQYDVVLEKDHIHAEFDPEINIT